MSRSGLYLTRISVLFFLVFFVLLIGYTLSLRNQNEMTAGQSIRQLAEGYRLQGPAPSPAYIEGLEQVSGLRSLLVTRLGEPEFFWGSEDDLVSADSSLDLDADGLWRVELQVPRGTDESVQAVFELVGRGEVFLVSRLGLLILLGYSAFVLVWYLVAQLRRRQKARPDENLAEEATSVSRKAVQQAERAPSPLAAADAPESSPSVANEPPIAPKTSDTNFVTSRNLLDERLAGELHRAGSNQTDLSLALVASDGKVDEERFHSVLREHFIYKDVLYFEAPRLCWVLLPQADLDAALQEFERLIGFLKKREAMGTSGPLPRVRAGISSRNGRIVGADRLIKECKTAVRKTGPSSPVVGFRPDPDKYRSFILQKSR